MHKTLGLAVATLGAAILVAPAAHAANIVANPGFETDDASSAPVSPPADWTVTAVSSISDAGVEDGFFNGGNNAAYIGYGTLSQALTTVVGTTYTVSFFVGINDTTTLTDPNATFDASVSGTSLGTTDLFGSAAPLTPGAPGPVLNSFVSCPILCSTGTPGTFTFTAEDPSTVISFTGLTTLSGSSPTGLWYVDDVDVEAQAAPEPSAVLVFGSALGMLTLMRARRLI